MAAYFEASTVTNGNESEILNFNVLQACSLDGFVSPGFGGFFTVESLNDLIDNTCNTVGVFVSYAIEQATITDLGDGTYRYYIRTSDMPNGFNLQDPFLWNSNFPMIFSLLLLDSEAPFFVFQYVDDTPPADLTICTECRQSNQQACGETYFIEAGLTSGDTYYAAITDRNNDVYIQAIIADVDGNLTIDALAPEFPVGFWLAESGNKSITVYEDEEMTIVSELTVGANVYTCMILTLQYMYTTTSGLIPDFAFYVSDTLDFYVDNSSNTYIA